MTDEWMTRKCDGSCGDESPHDSHLTTVGKAYLTDETPEENLFSDAESPREVLGLLAGYTSVCWDEDRTFESERASYAVDQALDRLEELGFISPADKEKL